MSSVFAFIRDSWNSINEWHLLWFWRLCVLLFLGITAGSVGFIAMSMLVVQIRLLQL